MAKGTVNKVTLIGRLGQDPEIRFTGEGNAVASFSVATNESWKDKDGVMQERTEWTKCTVFGPSAEKYIQPYVKKGTLVYVEGSLKTDKWQDKEGNELEQNSMRNCNRTVTELQREHKDQLGDRSPNGVDEPRT